MDLNIRADMRVLYKQGNSNWKIGTIMSGDAKISQIGLFVPIIPIGTDSKEEVDWAEINQL